MTHQPTLASPFAVIRQTRSDGTEFWNARDLQPLLGYDKWQTFESVIERARAACENSGQDADNHFTAAGKMVEVGSRAKRTLLDYQLSRYACYLVAMNGDPRKPEIANAQTYFAVRTHEAEVVAAQPAPALPSDPLELLTLSVQAMQQQKVQLQVLEHRLDTAPIRMDSKKRGAIHAACQRYARVHPAGYAGAYREFKGMFSNDGIPLAAYDDLPSHRFQEALEWLDMQIRVRGGAGLFDQAGD